MDESSGYKEWVIISDDIVQSVPRGWAGVIDYILKSKLAPSLVIL